MHGVHKSHKNNNKGRFINLLNSYNQWKFKCHVFILQLIQNAVSKEDIPDLKAFSLQMKRRSTKNVCIFCSNYQFGISVIWFDLQGLFQYCLGTAITVNDERRDWSTEWIVLLSAATRIWLERLASSWHPSYRPVPYLHQSQGTLQDVYLYISIFIHQFHWYLHPLILFFFISNKN